MTSRDLFGHPLRPEQLDFKQTLDMTASIRWGSSYFRISAQGACKSIALSTPDLPDLGPRWRAALAVLYPGRRPGEVNAKEAARDLGVDYRTVEAYAGGQKPRSDVLWQAFRRHGRRFLVLLAPELAPPSEAELLRAADALRETSAELAGAIAAVAKGETS